MKKMKMDMNMSKQGWLALSVIGIGGAMMLGKAWRKMT